MNRFKPVKSASENRITPTLKLVQSERCSEVDNVAERVTSFYTIFYMTTDCLECQQPLGAEPCPDLAVHEERECSSPLVKCTQSDRNRVLSSELGQPFRSLDWNWDKHSLRVSCNCLTPTYLNEA
jgi:hypothetical protein